jgi:hypothetical protein
MLKVTAGSGTAHAGRQNSFAASAQVGRRAFARNEADGHCSLLAQGVSGILLPNSKSAEQNKGSFNSGSIGSCPYMRFANRPATLAYSALSHGPYGHRIGLRCTPIRVQNCKNRLRAIGKAVQRLLKGRPRSARSPRTRKSNRPGARALVPVSFLPCTGQDSARFCAHPIRIRSRCTQANKGR